MRTRARAAYGAAVFHVLGAAAALACPTAADLAAGGIRVTGGDGTLELHHRLDQTRVEVFIRLVGIPEVSRTIWVHGVYLQSFEELDSSGKVIAGTRGEIDYAVSVDALPQPEPGLVWRSEQALVDDYSRVPETTHIVVGQPEAWRVAGCSYTILPVEVSTRSVDGNFVERFNYVPDLGIGVLVGYEDDIGIDRFTHVGIAAEAG